MSILLANAMTLTLTADVLLCGAAIVFVSAVVGFGSGVFYERTAARRAVSRAKRHLSQLVHVVVNSLENAREACAALDTLPNAVLSPRQLQQLDAKQNSLLETVSRVVKTQQSLTDALEKKSQPKPEPVEFSVTWQRDTESVQTDLPDRAEFDTNLEMLLEASQAADVASGLLLVKVDKYSQLRERCGSGGYSTLMRKLATVISRAGRDEDLLCRYAPDTLALLLPQVDVETGRRLAQKIRDSIRSYHFRLDESGPEVFMTASLGFTLCEPEDNCDLVVNRAGNAVDRSQRRGRNQLHLHDGETTVHCLAG